MSAPCTVRTLTDQSTGADGTPDDRLVDRTTDDAVRDLIERYALAVRELNSGAPMSVEQRAQLERELGVRTRRGRPRDPRVAAREHEIARRMRDHYSRLGRDPGAEPITRFAESLVEEYADRGRQFAVSDMFRLFARHRVRVESEAALVEMVEPTRATLVEIPRHVAVADGRRSPYDSF